MLSPDAKVYLAGPITGLSYDDARYGWRGDFAATLKDLGDDLRIDTSHIHLFSPMRGKDHLSHLDEISGSDGEYDNFISRGPAIVGRDRHDVKNAELVVFNFLGADAASVGSCIEIGWADAWQKASILVMEEDARDLGNPHAHLMVESIINYRVKDLREAAFATIQLTTPSL